jgi:hypothetical protein
MAYPDPDYDRMIIAERYRAREDAKLRGNGVFEPPRPISRGKSILISGLFALLFGAYIQTSRPSWAPAFLLAHPWLAVAVAVLVIALIMRLRRYWWLAAVGLIFYSGYEWWSGGVSTASTQATVTRSAPAHAKNLKRAHKREAIASKSPAAASSSDQTTPQSIAEPDAAPPAP